MIEHEVQYDWPPQAPTEVVFEPAQEDLFTLMKSALSQVLEPIYYEMLFENMKPRDIKARLFDIPRLTGLQSVGISLGLGAGVQFNSKQIGQLKFPREFSFDKEFSRQLIICVTEDNCRIWADQLVSDRWLEFKRALHQNSIDYNLHQVRTDFEPEPWKEIVINMQDKLHSFYEALIAKKLPAQKHDE